MTATLLCMLTTWRISWALWISHTDPAVPKHDACMAVGAWNNSAFLLGGYITKKSVIIFNGTHFDDRGNMLAVDTWGFGDYYTQIENNLYMIEPTGTSLNVYDMATREQSVFATIPLVVNYQSCLTADDSNLFIIGGGYSGSTSNIVRILNIAEMTWSDGISLQTARQRHSCIIDPLTQRLYAIGGYNDTILDSVEYINVSIMDEWETLVQTLDSPAYDIRSILYKPTQTIYIVGGYFDGTYLDTVHLLDPSQNTITLSPERMSYGVNWMALGIYNNYPHVFGGQISGGERTNKWMKYDPTITAEPTISPTIAAPTMNPTINPNSTCSSRFNEPDCVANSKCSWNIRYDFCTCRHSTSFDIIFGLEVNTFLNETDFQRELSFIEDLAVHETGPGSKFAFHTISLVTDNTPLQYWDLGNLSYYIQNNITQRADFPGIKTPYVNTMQFLRNAEDNFTSTYDVNRKQILFYFAEHPPCLTAELGGCPHSVCGAYAATLKYYGIRVIEFLFGSSVGPEYVECLAGGSYYREDVYLMEDYTDFRLPLLELSNVLCVETPQPTTSTPTTTIPTNSPTTDIPTTNIPTSPTTPQPTNSPMTTSQPTTNISMTVPTIVYIESSQASLTNAAYVCPAGCSKYYWDGCNICLCDSNGMYDDDLCTNMECENYKQPYCDQCNDDTFLCDDGAIIGRALNDNCEFRECNSQANNGLMRQTWLILSLVLNVMISCS